MRREIIIKYSWTGVDIPDVMKSLMEDEALERITQQLAAGYHSGELNLYDNEDEVEYRGAWSAEFKSHD